MSSQGRTGPTGSRSAEPGSPEASGVAGGAGVRRGRDDGPRWEGDAAHRWRGGRSVGLLSGPLRRFLLTASPPEPRRPMDLRTSCVQRAAHSLMAVTALVSASSARVMQPETSTSSRQSLSLCYYLVLSIYCSIGSTTYGSRRVGTPERVPRLCACSEPHRRPPVMRWRRSARWVTRTPGRLRARRRIGDTPAHQRPSVTPVQVREALAPGKAYWNLPGEGLGACWGRAQDLPGQAHQVFPGAPGLATGIDGHPQRQLVQ